MTTPASTDLAPDYAALDAWIDAHFDEQVQAAGLTSITNLIVRRPYGAGERARPVIALNAHGDVVPRGKAGRTTGMAPKSWTASYTGARPR